jgi:hypothetical protein
MDFVLTAYALRTGDFEEFNPIVKKFSLRGFALIKAFFSLVTFGILQISWNNSSIKVLELSLITSIVVLAVVSFLNLTLILLYRIQKL